MRSSEIIRLQNLTKLFRGARAVENISFEVCQGEVFGFLGPNGAGKTTTIRMILDLLRPTSGRIWLFGEELPDSAARIRRRCGYLPGNFSAYGNLTGLEYLRFCAALRGISRATDVDLIARFGLAGRQLDRKIKHLSHGNIQKLGIIQAFSHHPELLILDEPTIGLDPLMQETFYELIRESCSRGATIFISSHNLSEVERICHRVAIIRRGAVEITDSLDNLRRHLKRKLRIRLRQPVERLALENAELIREDGLEYEFVIAGDIRPLLRSLEKLPLESVVLPEPGLDEIFLSFYRMKDNG